VEGASHDERFNALLQPIRDLAGNWNIDVAAELEEYIDDLQNIQINFVDGETNLNFAEAALLIQGSACIYSKKVEFLHALVYKTLELLAQRKSTSNQDGEADADQGDSVALDDDAAGPARIDSDWEPISIKASTNLDLDESMLPPVGNLSTCTVGLLSRPPMAILALEHDESRADNKAKTTTNGLPSEFAALKVNTCCVHESGALLLDEGNRYTLDINLQPCVATHIPSLVENVVPPPEMDMFVEPEVVADIDVDFGGNDDTSDEDNGEAESGGEAMEEHEEVFGQERDADMAGEAPMLLFPPTPCTPATPATPGPSRGAADPWRQHDQHDGKATAAKPFRRGKTYRTLAEVRAAGKLATGDRKATSFRAPFFGCFAEGYLKEQKRRQGERAGPRRKLQQNFQNIADGASGAAIWAGCMAEEESELKELDDEDNDEGGDEDDGDIDVDMGADSMGTGDLGELVEGEPLEMGYEDLCRQHVETFFETSTKYVNESELSKRVSEWQERMGPVLADQDARKVFDIQAYGEHILDHFTTVECEESSSSFRRLTADVEPYEVCRMFLASLQLAADGNLVISTDAKMGEISEDIALTCVNSEARRPTKIMDGDKEKKKTKEKVTQKMRFADASPMVCETYGADVYDRAYLKMPSPAVFAPEPVAEESAAADADAAVLPPSPMVEQATKKARRKIPTAPLSQSGQTNTSAGSLVDS